MLAGRPLYACNAINPFVVTYLILHIRASWWCWILFFSTCSFLPVYVLLYTVSLPFWEDVLFSSFCIFRIMECNYTTNGKMQQLENEASSLSGRDTVYVVKSLGWNTNNPCNCCMYPWRWCWWWRVCLPSQTARSLQPSGCPSSQTLHLSPSSVFFREIFVWIKVIWGVGGSFKWAQKLKPSRLAHCQP